MKKPISDGDMKQGRLDFREKIEHVGWAGAEDIQTVVGILENNPNIGGGGDSEHQAYHSNVMGMRPNEPQRLTERTGKGERAFMDLEQSSGKKQKDSGKYSGS
ncbi:MAG: hypothetical protein AB7T38_01925 [Nitrospirales bacterium]